MKVAIFGKRFGNIFYNSCQQIFQFLANNKVEVRIYKPFYEFLLTEVKLKPDVDSFFETADDLEGVDMVFSIGGDGTFLETVTYVKNSGIPIVGINSGRLGFLAHISQEEIENALTEVFEKKCAQRPLDLLQLQTSQGEFNGLNFALNELTVAKRDSSSMITIHTYINDTFLNAYWADGLIIATSTGSTAYSLSVGGPILHPDTKNFIIAPIAPHNLTVRPLVVPNDVEITLKVEARGGKYLASLDSRSKVLAEEVVMHVKRANFKVSVIERLNASFYTTLRNKLMWGVDKRN